MFKQQVKKIFAWFQWHLLDNFKHIKYGLGCLFTLNGQVFDDIAAYFSLRSLFFSNLPQKLEKFTNIVKRPLLWFFALQLFGLVVSALSLFSLLCIFGGSWGTLLLLFKPFVQYAALFVLTPVVAWACTAYATILITPIHAVSRRWEHNKIVNNLKLTDGKTLGDRLKENHFSLLGELATLVSKSIHPRLAKPINMLNIFLATDTPSLLDVQMKINSDSKTKQVQIEIDFVEKVGSNKVMQKVYAIADKSNQAALGVIDSYFVDGELRKVFSENQSDSHKKINTKMPKVEENKENISKNENIKKIEVKTDEDKKEEKVTEVLDSDTNGPPI